MGCYTNELIPGREACAALLPARAFMIQRLIALLESGAAAGARPGMALLPTDADRLAMLARLRQAHARYTLGSGSMDRLGSGAWFKQRH
jgi:hypothetical protein